MATAKKSRGKRLLEADRRAQLVVLALRAFARRPYDDVSIDDVARGAGISRSLVFHYFPTKRDLYVAAMHEAARLLLAETETAPEGDPQARLRAGLDAYLAYVEEHAAAYGALLRGGIGSDKRVERIVEDTRRAFLDRLRAGLPFSHERPVVRAALRGWLGFVEGMALDWIDHRDVPRAQLRDVMSSALFDLLRLLTLSQ